MNREEFSEKLKEVTDILENNDLLYNIIFDYRTKQEFKNIKIQISDQVDTKQLVSYFGSVDKISDNFIQVLYGEIPLVFILINDKYWTNAYYYHSGEIMSYAINKMANNMGMLYTDKGLYYIKSKTPILVTNKVFDIMRFFELKERMLLTGFNTLTDIIEFIINSNYFNANIFSISDISTSDFLYDEKVEIYRIFLESIDPLKNIPTCQYESVSDAENLELIDLYFPESELLKKYIILNATKNK